MLSITNELDVITTLDDITTTYGYDDKGNQILIDGPLTGDEIITQYDDFDQVTSIDDPDLGYWTYKYNLLGELEYQRDTKQNCTVMTYDNLGRMTSRKYWSEGLGDCSSGTNAGQTTWLYDPSPTSQTYGLLIQEFTFGSNIALKLSKTNHYDEYLRLETTTTTYFGEATNGTDLVYTQDSYYDQYSRPLANYDATGGSVRYEYNDQGYQVNTIDQVTGVVYQTINEINQFGNIKEVVTGNGVITKHTYDELGRVTNIDTDFFNAQIQTLAYTYDTVGNLKTRKDNRDSNNVFEEVFTYDLLNRLNTVTTTSGGLSIGTMNISYDEAGRIDVFNGKDYQYNSPSIHGVSSFYDPNTSSTKSFVYDDNGNQTGSDGRTLVYNAFNKVEHMHKNNGTTSVKFEYDGNNSRYKRIDSGNNENETTYYIGNVEFIKKSSGTLLSKRYISDAVITNDITFGSSSDVVKYLHKDHLGSVQSITNATNPTMNNAQLSYDAFGRRRDMGSSDFYIDYNPVSDVTKRGFTGQEHIDQLGIINYNARLYDPSLGIMLQADTIIPDGPVTQSLNRYSYVFNNPLSYTDPSGHAPAIDWSYYKSRISFEINNSIGATGNDLKVNETTGKKILQNSSTTIPLGMSIGTFRGNGNGLGGNYFIAKKSKNDLDYYWRPEKSFDGVSKRNNLRLSNKKKTSKARHLTVGEKELVISVFGDEINVENPLIFNKKHNLFHPKNTAIAPNGNIYFNPKGEAYSEDFSKEGVGTKAFFLHEVTHVWQYQNNVNVFKKAIFNRNYDYLPLDSKKSFSDFGVEQQGEIVSDYYILKSGYFSYSKPSIQTYRSLIPFVK